MHRLYKYSQIPPFSEKWTLVFHFFSTTKKLTSPKKTIPRKQYSLTDNKSFWKKFVSPPILPKHKYRLLFFPKNRNDKITDFSFRFLFDCNFAIGTYLYNPRETEHDI